VKPKVLLGLTATPERTDKLDVLRFFDDHITAEIRLPDAINRKLLSPFQYFGIADPVDLSHLTWQRGAYVKEDLERQYLASDERTKVILQKLHEIVLDPKSSRGLGFCVSQVHAKYMAEKFNAAEYHRSIWMPIPPMRYAMRRFGVFRTDKLTSSSWSISTMRGLISQKQTPSFF